VISQLRGSIMSRRPNFIVLDVNGVGYGLHIPLSTYTRLEKSQGETTLLTYMHVAQDRLDLFGFSTVVERDLFHMLLAVSGVGPRLAINILSGISPEDLVEAIERKDEARLSRVPGIGRKIAARLTTELHDRVRKLSIERQAAGAGIRDDLLSALVNLGYPTAKAERAVEEAIRAGATEEFESLFKKALAMLSK